MSLVASVVATVAATLVVTYVVICFQSESDVPNIESSDTVVTPVATRDINLSSITLSDWSEDFRIGSIDSEELTVVVSDGDRRIGKTVHIIKNLEFLLESPLLKDITCDIKTQLLPLDLSGLCVSQWSNYEEQVFMSALDVDVMLDFFVNRISLNDYPRNKYILHLLTSHLLPPLCLGIDLRRKNLEKYLLFSAGVNNIFFADTLKEYESASSDPNVYPIQVITIQIGNARVVHTITVGDGVPLYRFNKVLQYDHDVLRQRLELIHTAKELRMYSDARLWYYDNDKYFKAKLTCRNIDSFMRSKVPLGNRGKMGKDGPRGCNGKPGPCGPRGIDPYQPPNTFPIDSTKSSWRGDESRITVYRCLTPECCYTLDKSLEERLVLRGQYGLCSCFTQRPKIDLSSKDAIKTIKTLSKALPEKSHYLDVEWCNNIPYDTWHKLQTQVFDQLDLCYKSIPNIGLCYDDTEPYNIKTHLGVVRLI